MNPLRIVFMGTPSFSLPALQMLHIAGYEIAGVITQPDRPQGRGQIAAAPAVKILAEKLELPVFQPENIREETSAEIIKSLSPKMIVVAAFGQILPKNILDIPPHGCLNIHPSLLPKYRGAAPINWTLIKGEIKTGVTIMLMDEGMDSGDILTQQETDITVAENFGHLQDRLARLGAQLLLSTIEQFIAGAIEPRPQDKEAVTFAPRLTKETGKINWHESAVNICNLIRGLSPAPGAYSVLNEKMIKIYAAEPLIEETGKTPGTIVEVARDIIKVATGDGLLLLKEVQLAGKKKMPVQDFLRGYQVKTNAAFGS